MKIHYRHGPRLYPDHRPRTRAECFTFPRPCPFVSCKWHLAHDAHRDRDRDVVILRIVNDDPASMDRTCALDEVDSALKYRDIGKILGLSHEISRRAELSALKKLRALDADVLSELLSRQYTLSAWELIEMEAPFSNGDAEELRMYIHPSVRNSAQRARERRARLADGGGKAHLRDPGHPGKARGSD